MKKIIIMRKNNRLQVYIILLLHTFRAQEQRIVIDVTVLNHSGLAERQVNLASYFMIVS
jgi:hypothetical protein